MNLVLPDVAAPRRYANPSSHRYAADVLLYDEPPTMRAEVPSGCRPSLLADLLGAGSARERQQTVRGALQAMGFDWLSHGRVLVGGDCPVPLSLCVTHIDVNWVRRYVQHAYHEVDPRLHQTLQSCLPCVWTLEGLAGSAQIGMPRDRLQRFIDDLGRTGMRSGAMLTVASPPRSSGRTPAPCERRVFSVFSRQPGVAWMNDAVLGRFVTLALCLHELYSRHTESAPVGRLIAPAVSQDPPISERELEVLDLLSRGFNYQEIADLLKVSKNTIGTHVKRIYGKLQVNSRGEATFEAREMGLLP